MKIAIQNIGKLNKEIEIIFNRNSGVGSTMTDMKSLAALKVCTCRLAEE